jgi:lipoprotein-anchoring transpeptidase ErfK/SrfK
MPIRFIGRAAGLIVRRRPRRHQSAQHHQSWLRRPSLLSRQCLLVCLSLGLVLIGSGCGSSTAPKAVATTANESGGQTGGAGSSTGIPDAGSPDHLPAGSSLVATARNAKLEVRGTPDGPPEHTMANPTAIGAPLTFLVLKSTPDWLQVALPIRPNGSSGWIRRSEVELSITPYRLVISRSAHRLDVFYGGRRTARYPVGVGKSATPTPSGTYYLTELIQPPNPAGSYGPYAFGLSAFSDTLQTFAGGPGQLGLHGTDTPKGLGHDVSHGCLRVANSVITKLAGELPLGTPLQIQA